MKPQSIIGHPFWRSKVWAAIAVTASLTGGALLLFWNALSGRLILPMKFVSHYGYAYAMTIQHWLYDLGSFPNWWPSYNSGYPINLGLDSFLNPFLLLSLKFFSPFFANNFLIFLFFILNGVAMYALVRAFNLSPLASGISAISYNFSGFIIYWISTTPFALLFPFLPLSFLCCLKISQRKWHWLWLWIPLLTYAWIGGFAELVVYSLPFLFAFVLYLSFQEKGAGTFPWKYTLIFLGVVLCSVLILSPWFLSILHFIGYSTRANVSSEVATQVALDFSYFLKAIHPRLAVFNGELFPLSFGNAEMEFLLYIGTLPLFFVLASFWLKHKKEKKYYYFFLGVFILSLLIAVKHSPLFWLIHKIPVINWFRMPWKWSLFTVFSAAILAGYGFDYIQDFFRSLWSKKILVGLWIIALLIVSGVSIITIKEQAIKNKIINYGIAQQYTHSDRALQRSSAYYENVISEMGTSLIDNFSFRNKYVVLTALLWLLALIHFTVGAGNLIDFVTWRRVAFGLTWFTSVFMWIGVLDGQPISYITQEPAVAAYLHRVNPYKSAQLPLDAARASQVQPYRIYNYLPDQHVAILSEQSKQNLATQAVRDKFKKEIMDDNLHIFFDFDMFHNHQSLALQRLVDVYLLARRQAQQLNSAYSDHTPFAEYLNAFVSPQNQQLLGMLNIRYILTPFELPGKKAVFTGTEMGEDFPIYIYENPYFLPRWYFARNILWSENDDAAAFRNLQTITDFKNTTLVEVLSPNDRALAAKADPNDTFQIEYYGLGKLRVKTNTSDYRFFIFSENRQPFWQATVNHTPVPLYTANYLFQAVLVPPGENIIEFTYPSLWDQSLYSSQTLFTKMTDALR